MSRRASYLPIAAVAVAGFVVASLAGLRAGQVATGAVAIDNDDIGGVVTGPRGPEAGVWVIAETRDLPTRLIKVVVTDDRGHYVVPDLPKANYDVWVRGYGLVDSAKVKAAPGKALNLTAVAAPNPPRSMFSRRIPAPYCSNRGGKGNAQDNTIFPIGGWAAERSRRSVRRGAADQGRRRYLQHVYCDRHQPDG